MMWKYNYSLNLTLYHSGVKGMKWGVRRYQNEDGTLTELGKRRLARYNEGRKDKTLWTEQGDGELLSFTIYPSEYFAPINFTTHRIHITKNTRTIHHYMASWTDNSKKTWKSRLYSIMPEWILIANNRLKWMMRKRKKGYE